MTGSRGSKWRIALEVDADNLSEVRARIAAVAERMIPDRRERLEVLLAVEEAVQNVIRYAYAPEELPGRLEATAWLEGDDFIIELRDHAAPVDLGDIRPRSWDPEHPGGLGLRLIRASMDDVRYDHAPGGTGNILRMRKHLG